jgi:hypothetical protein
MRGQVETIKILVVRDITGQRHHAYKYEVVAPDSQDYQAVDDVFARDGEIEIRAGHTYQVRFREAGSGRWIDEIVREIRRIRTCL